MGPEGPARAAAKLAPERPPRGRRSRPRWTGAIRRPARIFRLRPRPPIPMFAA